MKQALRTSIRLKLAVLVSLVVLFALLAFSAVAYVFARKTLRAQIHDRLWVVASDRQRLLAGYIQQQEERVALVASRTRLRQLLADVAAGRAALATIQEETRRILLDAQRSIRGVTAIWITDTAGRALTSTDDTYLGQDFASAPWFATAAAEPDFQLEHDAQGRDQALAAAPVKGEDGRTLAVVLMRADAEPIMQLLADRTGLGQTGEVLVGSRTGEILRYLLAHDVGTETVEVPAGLAPAMRDATLGLTGFRQTHDWRGAEVLAAYRPVGHRDWGLVAKMGVVEAYQSIAELRRLFLISGLLVLLVGLLGAFELARRFVKPVQRLAALAKSIAGGGLNARVVVESSDEIGELSEAFNQMTGEVAHAHAALEDRVQERTAEWQAERDMLEQLMNRSPDRIFFKDLQSRFVRINRPLAEFFKAADPAAMLGKTDFDVFSKEHAEQAFADEQQIIRTGEPMLGKEEKETWPDGRVTWASTTKAPLRDKDGRVIGTFGISRDVTARRQAEEELNRYFALSPDLFCIADFRGYFKRLNPAWEQVLGYTTAELQAQPFIQFVHPDDREATVAQFQKNVQGQRAQEFENRYRCKDGSYRWLQWSAIVQPEEQLIHAVARDISEHKRAQELLSQFAQALNQKNQEMQEDLRMAREIQMAFLPQRFPTFPRGAGPESSALRFFSRYLTTSTLGGDFFDVLPLSESRAGIFICDVMGHGTRAALVTAVVRGLLDELRPLAGNPGQFLTEINRALLANLRGASTTIFASACYVVMDAVTGQVECANAGHPSPLCLRAAQQLVERCRTVDEVRGPVLGLIAEHVYPTAQSVLAAGDTMVLFTDGLYEVEGPTGEIFGLGRVESTLQQRMQLPCGQIFDELVAAAKSYSAKGEFTDDVCLVGVQLAGLMAAPPPTR